MFLPLADPATGALAFTFFACSSERMELIEQLIAATRQRMALGVRALPVVELAREIVPVFRHTASHHPRAVRAGSSPVPLRRARSP